MNTRTPWRILAGLVVLAAACSESPTGVELEDEPAFAAAAAGTTFYVSPTGNDKNNGTSIANAWKTINKVNSRNWSPGDKILFQGGATFTGSLSFTAEDAGTPASPVTISTFGTGRATINSPTAEAIYVYNAGGFDISNLVLAGPGLGTSAKPGLSFYVDLNNDVKLAHVYVNNVEVYGFRRGITFGSWNNNTGYIDVRVTNSSAHDNALSGVNSYAMNPYAHQSFYFGRITAYNNLGDATVTNAPSGNGIVLGGVDGGTIERSIAYNNGQLCTAASGPVGIWAYDSNNIVIQYNESYNNKTGGPSDGGGFDLDQNTKNSVVQYNYSHGNAGPGYLLAQGPNNTNFTGNIIRYNISENDGRKNSNGAIVVWGRVLNTQIYNNTVYLSTSSAGSPRGVYVHNSAVTQNYATNVGIRNNIIQVTGSLRLVQVSAGMANGSKNLRFENNNYFSTGSAFKIAWKSTTYSNLAAWRTASGQEMLNGAAVGYSVDPQLAAAGAGGTIGNVDLLGNLGAYKLMGTSTMGDQGVNLYQLGLSPGSSDYYGNTIPQGTQYSLGAHDK
jgi:hypothetical protein